MNEKTAAIVAVFFVSIIFNSMFSINKLRWFSSKNNSNSKIYNTKPSLIVIEAMRIAQT